MKLSLFAALFAVSSALVLHPAVPSRSVPQAVPSRSVARVTMVESWYDSGVRLDGSTAAPASTAVEDRFDPAKDTATNAVAMPGGLPVPVVFAVLAGILLVARGGDLGIGGMAPPS